ncbi:MAG: hypothetical protein GX353_03765 [Oligella ureolytica]|nr:hypothetical protein [Oligella ureolytica]
MLKALGLSSERINSAIRIGIGRFNTKQDILTFVDKVSRVLKEFEV